VQPSVGGDASHAQVPAIIGKRCLNPVSQGMIANAVDHCRIEAQLGVGGMGVAYGAYDTVLRRRVAIEFLVVVSDDESRTRLSKEARAASPPNHPNICTIHEIAEADGQRQPCIVMEYLQRTQLESMIVPRWPAVGHLLPLQPAGRRCADARARSRHRASRAAGQSEWIPADRESGRRGPTLSCYAVFL
jgi:hypothetical protein